MIKSILLMFILSLLTFLLTKGETSETFKHITETYSTFLNPEIICLYYIDCSENND